MQYHSDPHYSGVAEVPYYGGAGDFAEAAYPTEVPMNKRQGLMFKRGQRTRLNILPVLLVLFVPLTIFGANVAALTFWVHYDSPIITYLILAFTFGVVVVLGCLSLQAMRQKTYSPANYEPSWMVVMFLFVLLAWILSVSAGSALYSNYMAPVYDTENLNRYVDVDPALMRGQQLMDAGKIQFVNGSKLDLTKAMSFTNLDRYCVAPIVKTDNNSTAQGSMTVFDFWAVGQNCCDRGKGASYHCGQFSNPHAKSGIRLMSDEGRAYYRLAVQQAEAAYNIHAPHPLFFEWTADPTTDMQEQHRMGVAAFLACIASYLVVQIVLVFGAVVFFSKLGHA